MSTLFVPDGVTDASGGFADAKPVKFASSSAGAEIANR